MRTPPEGALIVRLDATDADVEHPAEVAAQIPHADEQPRGSATVVEANAVKRRAGLGRLLGDGRVKVSRVARCSALLARGYVGIEADGEAVWGVAPHVAHGARDDHADGGRGAVLSLGQPTGLR